ncbi:MAG: Hsp20/alpha crystallin family protein [Bacteroidota bacterium]
MPMFSFNPAWELDNLSNEFNKMVKTLSSPENRPRISFGGFQPRVDITEDTKGIYFDIEIPGVKKVEMKVTVSDENILTIQGDKKFEKKDDVNAFCRNERQYGNFSRAFQLPELVDASKIEAKYENGMLFLSIPKLEPVKPKEVEVQIQ